MPSLGRAFIEVHADTSPFARQVRQQLRKLAQDMRENTDRAGNLLGQRMGLGARKGFREAFGRRPLTVDADIDIDTQDLAQTEAALDTVTRDREVDVRVNREGFLRGLSAIGGVLGTFVTTTLSVLGDLFNFGRSIGSALAQSFQGISGSMGGVRASAGNLATSLAGLAAVAASLAVVLFLLGGAFGVVLAVSSLLYDSLLLILTLLPGLGAVAVASIAPLVLIFTNLGDAIKATTGPLEEFESTIEDFGPNTRSVLTSLREMIQFFLGLREAMQESFFGPVEESISSLQRSLGPTFTRGFDRLAGAAGRFAGAFIELFDHPQARGFFDRLFRVGELGFDEVGDAALNLVAAFANLADETLPNVRELLLDIAEIINGWADSINRFADDNNLQQTLAEWEDSFNAIWRLIGNIVDLAQTLFNQFREDGVPLVERINRDLERMIGFFRSHEGQLFFDGLRVSASFLLTLIAFIVAQVGQFFVIVGAIHRGWDRIVDLVKSGIEPFGVWREAGEIIADLMREGILPDIRETFGWVRNIRDAFDDFMDRLRGGLGSARTLLSLFSGTSRESNQAEGNIRGMLGRLRRTLSPARGLRSVLRGVRSVARGVRSALSSAAFWVGRIRDIAASISFPSVPGGFFSGVFGSIFGADGGIINRPTNLIAGEAGPEVLIPLTRPNRAQELMEATGLAERTLGGDGAGLGSPGMRRPLLRLEFVSDGTAAGDAVLELLRNGVRIRGGDVQEVIGQ